MNVLHNHVMILWTKPSFRGTVLQADMGLRPGESVASALARYKAMWPDDIILGVKDKSGRFVA